MGPRGGFTGRAAVLGLVVCALVLSLAYPARQYLAQRGSLAHLAQQREAAQRRVAALTGQAARLRDPAYVRAEARRRLQYVMPGDSVYLVISSGGQPAPAPRPTGVPTPPPDAGQPWYSRLWGTVQAADQP